MRLYFGKNFFLLITIRCEDIVSDWRSKYVFLLLSVHCAVAVEGQPIHIRILNSPLTLRTCMHIFIRVVDIEVIMWYLICQYWTSALLLANYYQWFVSKRIVNFLKLLLKWADFERRISMKMSNIQFTMFFNKKRSHWCNFIISAPRTSTMFNIVSDYYSSCTLILNLYRKISPKPKSIYSSDNTAIDWVLRALFVKLFTGSDLKLIGLSSESKPTSCY